LFCTLSNLFTDDQGHPMHEVHHTASDGTVFSSSGERGPLCENIGSGTDVDMPTCRSAEIESDRDHATETILEGIQASCDASDKDHSADLPATTLVTAESNKITTCDMEVVCAGNPESSGGGEDGTMGVQEAAAVANHGGADLNDTGMHDQVLAGSGNKGAPGGVLQGNPSHPTNSPSPFPVRVGGRELGSYILFQMKSSILLYFLVVNSFFLEYAGELRIISLIEEEFTNQIQHQPHTLDYIRAFVESKTTYF
jgi:hypothetical protein